MTGGNEGKMAGSRTLSVTFTMRLTEPLTKAEKDAVIVSLWEHIRDERAEGTPGFTRLSVLKAPSASIASLRRR